MAIAKGMAEETPFSHTLRDLKDLTSLKDMGKTAGKMALSDVVPRMIQEGAEAQDSREGQPVKRDPKGFLDAFKSGIPKTPLNPDFNRQSVPEKTGPPKFGNANAAAAMDAHNKADRERPWHVPQVGAQTLYKLPVPEREPFKKRVAELQEKLISGKITTFETEHPDDRTHKKMESAHDSAYNQAKREFRKKFITEPKGTK